MAAGTTRPRSSSTIVSVPGSDMSTWRRRASSGYDVSVAIQKRAKPTRWAVAATSAVGAAAATWASKRARKST